MMTHRRRGRSTPASDSQSSDDDDDDDYTSVAYGSRASPRHTRPVAADDRSVPDGQLRLDWVYGYQGMEYRNNIVCNRSDNLVYFVAGVCIVYDIENKTQSFYREHEDDVSCISLHPKRELVASGEVGELPSIFVWDSDELDTKSILTGVHRSDIVSVSFGGPSDKLLVSADRSSTPTIVVWQWKSGTPLSSTQMESGDIATAEFNPYESNILTSCDSTFGIRFWTLSGNVMSVFNGVIDGSSIQSTQLCLAFGPDRITYSGGANGDILVWKGNHLQFVLESAHQGAITAIAMCKEGYATSGRDGVCRLWTPTFDTLATIDLIQTTIGYKGLAVSAVFWNGMEIFCGTEAGEIFELNYKDQEPEVICQGHPAAGELWGLATHPSLPLFATASEDMSVRIWHVETHELLGYANTTHHARSVSFSAVENHKRHIAVGLKHGIVEVFSIDDVVKHVGTKASTARREPIELVKVKKIQAAGEVVHELKYSPNNQYLAAGSNDGSVHFYDVNKQYSLAGKLDNLDSYVTHLDFNFEGTILQVNTGRGTQTFCAVPSGSQLELAMIEKKHPRWRSWTGICGKEMNGIWNKFYSEPDDVNAAHAIAGVVVTGDDFGKVKLFRFPCIVAGARYREYRGHSADVTNVRFTGDEKWLITTGGADHSVFQWKFYPDGGAEPVAGHESHFEESDSDASMEEVDSDLELESAISYERKSPTQSKPRRSNNLPRSRPPETKLTLERVHGYRGYDCRNNVVFIDDEVVYHIAAVGILHNPKTDSQRFYLQHTDDILCLARHPKVDLIATGQIGKHAEIHVWDAASLETRSVLVGHTRGVCALDFHSDGKKLISVGLDSEHMIIAWDWVKGLKLATTRGHKDKIFAVKWNSFSKNGVVSVGMRHIKFWNLAGSGFTSKRGVFGKKGKIETMTCIDFYSRDSDEYTLTGGVNGLIYEWKDNNLHRCIKAHDGPIFVLNNIRGLCISGGKDGVLKIWPSDLQGTSMKEYKLSGSMSLESGSLMPNSVLRAGAVHDENGNIVIGTSNGELVLIEANGRHELLTQGHGHGEVWGLSCSPRSELFATASDDKTVRIWSAKSHKMIGFAKLPKAGRSCAISPKGQLLAVGTKDGQVYIFELPGFELFAEFEHRKKEIGTLKFSPDGKYLVAGSHDSHVDLYDISCKKRVGVGKGASSYITQIDWNQSSDLFVINSGAKEIIYFSVPKCKRQIIPDHAVAKIRWDSITTVLGDHCEGIWPPSSDVTDVNAAHVCSDGTVMATADDFGQVKLFQYPVKGEHSKFKKYSGHSAHVTNVRFLFDDSKLISVGGADTAILVWNFLNSNAVLDTENFTGAAGESDDSDTDDDEEGYDSDVEREKTMNYADLTYDEPLRVTAGVKPHMKELAGGTNESRSVNKIGRQGRTPRVQRRQAESNNEAHRNRSIMGFTLEHVHGYRGYDCRDNLMYNGDGLVVYHAAAAGIVLDPSTNRQSFYLEHNDDIVSLDINPYYKYSNVVATGQIGKDADIHVWETTTSQTLSIIRGFHKTAVCSLSFSSNGKLLLSVDASESHGIAIYKWTTGMLMASASGDKRRIFVAKFRPDSDSEFVTCGVKHVRFWRLTGGTLQSTRGVVGDRRMPTMLSLAFGDTSTFTGSVNGEIFEWQNNKAIRIVAGHEGPIFSMISMPAGIFGIASDNFCIVSGGKDGKIKYWRDDLSSTYLTKDLDDAMIRSISPSQPDMLRDSDSRKILVGTRDGTIFEIIGSDQKRQLSFGHSLGEMWALATHPTQPVFASGSDDRTICLWDLDSHKPKQHRHVKSECRSLAFSPDGHNLAAGLANGAVMILNSSNLKESLSVRDRKGPANVVRFSPNGKYLAVGCEQGAIDIYSTSNRYKRIAHTGGESTGRVADGGFVMHIDWSTDSSCIQIDTSNYEHVCLELPNLKPVGSQDRTWASWTSILGDEVLGIWPKDSGKADVNCCDLAHDSKTIVTGDDFGTVKLFKFPCGKKYTSAISKQVGHSAHVTNVKFSFDDEQIISTGGADSCVFVWKSEFDTEE